MGNNGNSTQLERKVALVTGGSRGIGRAIALRLAEDGADVAINYQNTKEHAEDVSRLINQMCTVEKIEKLCAVIDRMDTRENAKEVNRMKDEVVRKFCRIDILVNNAWSEVLAVNLNGAFNCTKAVIDGMLERKYGRIINISSVIGRMGNFGQANYAASKAGLIGLTQTLAKEFVGKGITVNAPGFIETDMVSAAIKHKKYFHRGN